MGGTDLNRINRLDTTRVITEPWEKLKGESQKPYNYFCMYRDMGAQRSMAKLARQLGRTKQAIEQHSRKHAWVERAMLWDAEQDRRRRAQLEEIGQEMAERHIRFALLIQEKVIMRLKTMPVEKLGTRELAQLVDIAVKMERTALGEPNEFIQHSGQLQEMQNIYNDIKVIHADPDALDRAIERWETLAAGTSTRAVESRVDGTHPEPE